jgi:hypothetical protein
MIVIKTQTSREVMRRVRHSRMLLAGIQARPELDPRLNIRGDAFGINRIAIF